MIKNNKYIFFSIVDNTFSSNKQIILNNLTANSIYHYVVMTTDVSGNVTLTWPSTFTTGQ